MTNIYNYKYFTPILFNFYHYSFLVTQLVNFLRVIPYPFFKFTIEPVAGGLRLYPQTLEPVYTYLAYEVCLIAN